MSNNVREFRKTITDKWSKAQLGFISNLLLVVLFPLLFLILLVDLLLTTIILILRFILIVLAPILEYVAFPIPDNPYMIVFISKTFFHIIWCIMVAITITCNALEMMSSHMKDLYKTVLSLIDKARNKVSAKKEE